MKKILLIALIQIFSFKLIKAQSIDWTQRIKTNSVYYFGIMKTKIVKDKSIYTVGAFKDSIKFSNGIENNCNYAQFGNSKIFIQKADSNGKILWVKFTGELNTNPFIWTLNNVDINDNGKIVCSIYFNKIVDVDPSNKIKNLDDLNGRNATIYLDSSANLTNTVQNKFGSNHIVFDNNNNYFQFGFFSDTIDFDPGPGVYKLTPNIKFSSMLFISKSRNNGDLLWVKSYDQPNIDNKITTDKANNIYISGTFRDSFNVDPGVSNQKLFAQKNKSNFSSRDSYIIKLDSNGNFKWAKSFGTKAEEWITLLKTDNNQNVYFSMSFNDTLKINTKKGLKILMPQLNKSFILGDIRTCLVKLDKNGLVDWVQSPKNDSTSFTEYTSMTTDEQNQLILGGHYQLKTTLDSSINSSQSFSVINHKYESFVQKIDSNGKTKWLFSLPESKKVRQIVSLDCKKNKLVCIGKYLDSTFYIVSGRLFYNLDGVNGFITKINVPIDPVTSLIDELFDDKKINIYPNPTNNIINIESNQEIKTITVSNIQGQQILATKSKTIDLSQYAAGMYVVQIVNSNEERFIKKVIKRE